MLFAQDFRSACAPIFVGVRVKQFPYRLWPWHPKPTAADMRQAPAAHVSGGCAEAQVSAGFFGVYIVHAWQAERGYIVIHGYTLSVYTSSFRWFFVQCQKMSRNFQRLCVLGNKNLFVGFLLSSWKFLRFIAPPCSTQAFARWCRGHRENPMTWCDSTMTWCDSAWGC